MAKTPYPMKALAEKWRHPKGTEDVKICKICDKELMNPRILPCLHVFCEECLLLLLRTYELMSKLDRTFFCPVCKVRTPCHLLGRVSQKWAELFPKKESVDRLKDANLVVEEICKPCHKTLKVIQATKFCTDCREFMCGACELEHKPRNKLHRVINYEVKEMKTTPISFISKFQCKVHSNLRVTTYCETHATFLCNTCKENELHRTCNLNSNVVDLTARITKAESKINTVNSLKRNERNKGKQLLKLIEQLHSIQGRLQAFRDKQELRYCRYVQEAIITEQKTEAMDALKGKVEFDKSHRQDNAIYTTMSKVGEIVTGYAANLLDEDERTVKADIHKYIGEVEKILERPLFDVEKSGEATPGRVQSNPQDSLPWMKDSHTCKKHVNDTMDEGSLKFYGPVMESVGSLNYNKMAATCFRVGSKYIMTVAHTVRDIVDPDRTGKSDWSALEDERDVFVIFDSPPTSRTKRFGIKRLVPFLNDDLNIAVLEIIEPTGLPNPLVLCMKDSTKLKLNDVTTVGYGVPGSYNKHLNIKCNVIKMDSDRAKHAMSWLKSEELKVRCSMLVKGKDPSSINWNYDEMARGDRVAVECCLEYRALGSPVLIKYGDIPHPVVVGIFTHNSPDCYSELPKRAQKEYRDFRFDLATSMSSLHEVLVIESKVLAGDIFIKDKKYFERENSFEALLKHERIMR